jgi:hypothetical protein
MWEWLVIPIFVLIVIARIVVNCYDRPTQRQ